MVVVLNISLLEHASNVRFNVRVVIYFGLVHTPVIETSFPDIAVSNPDFSSPLKFLGIFLDFAFYFNMWNKCP